MVRQLSTTRTRGWKAALATFVAMGAVAWHIMACIESPMSFSPTGDLAFVVMDHFNDDDDYYEDIELIGDRAFRLMVLTSEKELREIERTTTRMLTAPAYSPGGEQFAYLRLPLLTPEDRRRIRGFIKERKKQYEQATSDSAAEKWIFVAPEGFVPESPKDGMEDWGVGWDDVGLLPLGQAAAFILGQHAGGGVIPVELVVRQASTGKLIQSLPLRIPHTGNDGDSLSRAYAQSYAFTRPQYSPDGGWVYFAMNELAVAASPSTGEGRVYAVGVTKALLSPDGETLATFSKGNLGFLRIDGQRMAYVRHSGDHHFSAAAWADNETLVVLPVDKGVLAFFDADGRHLRSDTLPDEVVHDDGGEELSLSPDGEYMVVADGGVVHFLTTDGQVLGSWQAEEGIEQFLVHPTFMPDSRQVALKLVTVDETEDEKWVGTSAIVYFTPEGQEVFRVPVPRISRDEISAPPAPTTEEAQQ